MSKHKQRKRLMYQLGKQHGEVYYFTNWKLLRPHHRYYKDYMRGYSVGRNAVTYAEQPFMLKLLKRSAVMVRQSGVYMRCKWSDAVDSFDRLF